MQLKQNRTHYNNWWQVYLNHIYFCITEWFSSKTKYHLNRKIIAQWHGLLYNLLNILLECFRCEDICWIRTNIKNPGHSKNLEAKAVFQRTKEHCLMGIKGTVRRSTDGDFIHANVDIDLIISEETEYGSLEKPVEIFHIIEHFCLGRRRLHIFGRDSTIRPGWLTLGPELTNTNFNSDLYNSYFTASSLTTSCTERIEALRPKSPPPKGKGNSGGRGRGGFSRGRGRGRWVNIFFFTFVHL